MANEFIMAFWAVDTAILWGAIMVMAASLRKLSDGEFRRLSIWVLLVLLLFVISFTFGTFEPGNMPDSYLYQMYLFTLLIAIVAIKVALDYRKFTRRYGFSKGETLQKKKKA